MKREELKIELEKFIRWSWGGQSYIGDSYNISKISDKYIDEYLSTLPDEKEHEYHLNCTYCHTPFWSKEAFPIPQICDECKSNQP